MSQAWLGKTKLIRSLGAGVAAGITATMMIISFAGPNLLLRLENASLDARFIMRGPIPADPAVVLVAIDEESVQEVGRWPWPRDIQARVIDGIGQDHPKVIGLDIIYAEPESRAARLVMEDLLTALNGSAVSPQLRARLQGKLNQFDTDRRLADSIASAGTVVLAMPFVVPETGTSANPAGAVEDYVKAGAFALVRNTRSGEAMEPYRASDVRPPLKPFAEHAIGVGHVYSLPDPDGITRYEYMAVRHGDDYYPSLALEIARVFLDVPRERVALRLGQGVQLGDRLIPTDQKGRMLINYLGRERQFRYVSAADVLHRRVPAGIFRDNIVLVGTSALGTYDQKATPFSANVPGIEKNATVVHDIVQQAFVHKPWWAGLADLSLILAFGGVLGYALPRMRAFPAAVLALGLLLTYAVGLYLLFVFHGLWLDAVAPILTVLLIFISMTVLRFTIEEKQAKEVRTLFSSYVSPHIVDELIKDPSKARIGGQRRELTMLFSDVVGFTSFSEKHDAEAVVAQLNEYLEAMTDVIFRWNGTLDKFVGDSIVVFWNAPIEQVDHVELAVKCALHMRRRLGELQAKWRLEGRMSFDTGIGINTGTAVVGNIGAQGKKMDYTMIGDYVNLTARVEGLTRRYDTGIILTDYTAVRLKTLIADSEGGDNRGRLGHIALHKLGVVKVKGKDQTVVVYALQSLGRNEQSTVDESASGDTVEILEK